MSHDVRWRQPMDSRRAHNSSPHLMGEKRKVILSWPLLLAFVSFELAALILSNRRARRDLIEGTIMWV